MPSLGLSSSYGSPTRSAYCVGKDLLDNRAAIVLSALSKRPKQDRVLSEADGGGHVRCFLQRQHLSLPFGIHHEPAHVDSCRVPFLFAHNSVLLRQKLCPSRHRPLAFSLLWQNRISIVHTFV
jgi:hypothetical protein